MSLMFNIGCQRSGREDNFTFFVYFIILKSLLRTIYDYIGETLTRENEPSLRLLSEWILVRLIIDDRKTRLNDLYDYLKDAHRHRTGTICAWISIASHVTTLLSNPMEQVNQILFYCN